MTINECLRGNATRISQFLSILVSREPCCYLSSKKLAWINFLLFCRLGTSFNTGKKNNLAFYVQSKSVESTESFKSWIFKSFLYWNLKATVLICQIINVGCWRSNATRICQSIPILVSCDPWYYLSRKRLAWPDLGRLETSFNSVKM